MIKVNLLPKEIQEKGKGADWVILAAALIGVFAIIALSSYAMKLQNYKKDLMKKDRWAAQLADIKGKVAKVEQLDAQKSLLNAKKNTVVQLLQGRLLYPKFMEDFYRTVPKDVWLSNLALSQDGKNIKITASSNALSINAIADWLQTLESKPEQFSGATLSAINVKLGADPKDPVTYTFSMTFTYIPPAGV